MLPNVVIKWGSWKFWHGIPNYDLESYLFFPAVAQINSQLYQDKYILDASF